MNNIEYLYKEINREDRRGFIIECANHFSLSPNSIKSNWFSGLFCPPKKHVSEVTKMLQNKIKNQK